MKKLALLSLLSFMGSAYAALKVDVDMHRNHQNYHYGFFIQEDDEKSLFYDPFLFKIHSETQTAGILVDIKILEEQGIDEFKLVASPVILLSADEASAELEVKDPILEKGDSLKVTVTQK